MQQALHDDLGLALAESEALAKAEVAFVPATAASGDCAALRRPRPSE